MFGIPATGFKFQLDTLNICQGKMHTIEDAEAWDAIGEAFSSIHVIDCLDGSFRGAQAAENTRGEYPIVKE